MSGKTTAQRRKARLALAEARARDMRATLQRIVARIEVAEKRGNDADPPAAVLDVIGTFAENAVKQDDERLAPDRLRKLAAEMEREHAD